MILSSSIIFLLLAQRRFIIAFTSSSLVPKRIHPNLIPSHRFQSQLYNIPPPGLNADPQIIKDAADRESPPQSFFQLQINSARAAELAIRDGHKLIEVEVGNKKHFRPTFFVLLI